MPIPPPAIGWTVRPNPYTLTATERAELLNWACFDALPAMLPVASLHSDRYINSPEFQSEDVNQMHQRMTRILESVPTGSPVSLSDEHRTALHLLLDESWFNSKLTDHVSHWGTSQSSCFLRARYLFVTYWLDQGQEADLELMRKKLDHAVDLGLNKRYALQSLNFDGTRVD